MSFEKNRKLTKDIDRRTERQTDRQRKRQRYTFVICNKDIKLRKSIDRQMARYKKTVRQTNGEYKCESVIIYCSQFRIIGLLR